MIVTPTAPRLPSPNCVDSCTRILIADEDRTFRDSLQCTLQGWGYHVQAVSDGNRAWDLLRTSAPELAILDWRITGSDGIELCRKVRLFESPLRTYIILVSGRASTADIVAGLDAGADDYVIKPLDFQNFHARIRVGLRMIRLQRQLSERARNLEQSLEEVRQLELEAEESRQRERYLAFHDALTGLPNRQLFFDRLQQAMSASERSGHPGAVLFLDLNGYKEINDTLGHAAGDQVLKLVAQRLKGCLRESDTVARLGGDEFGVISSGLSKQADAEIVAGRILNSLSTPFEVEHQSCNVGGSVGICLFPSEAAGVEEIIKRADMAMYRAKRQGTQGFHVHNCSTENELPDRKVFEHNLHEALEHDQFLLHFQPQASLATRALIGTEALVHWRKPNGELIPPGDFIPGAEETGLIVPLGRWALRMACKQAAHEKSQGSLGLRMAVNLSARQFRSADLLKTVADALEESHLSPESLELEITESVAMQNLDHSLKTMQRLKDMGLRLALDEFGTGYSSLSSLKRFPIDALKLNQSFVEGLPGDKENALITTAIVSMAHRLKLAVLAEGVETVGQWDFLRSVGCDEAQGCLVSPAVSVESLEEIVQGRRPLVREQASTESSNRNLEPALN